MSDTPTPHTDAEIARLKHIHGGAWYIKFPDFVRTLERKLAAMIESRNNYADGFSTQNRLHEEFARKCEDLERELADAREIVKRQDALIAQSVVETNALAAERDALRAQLALSDELEASRNDH